MRSTKPPSSRMPRRVTTPAKWPGSGRRWKTCRSSWGRPRRRWNPGNERLQKRCAAYRCPHRAESRRLPPVIVVDTRHDPQRSRGQAIGRTLQSAMKRTLLRRRAGDFVFEPAGLLADDLVPVLRRLGEVPALRCHVDLASGPQSLSVPRLRLSNRRRQVPGMRARHDPLFGQRHAAVGTGSPLQVSQRPRAADGQRFHAAVRKLRCSAQRVPHRRSANPLGHADDRQGAGFSQRALW